MEAWSVERVVEALNRGGVRYLIVGGLAVNAHGYERMTRDIDLVLRLEPENILSGIRALEELGYEPGIPVRAEEMLDPERREMWKREKNMLVLPLWSEEHARTPVDVFIEEPFDFEEEHRKAMNVEIGEDLFAPVISLDGLLRMKAAAGRLQDLADAEALREIRKPGKDGDA